MVHIVEDNGKRYTRDEDDAGLSRRSYVRHGRQAVSGAPPIVTRNALPMLCALFLPMTGTHRLQVGMALKDELGDRGRAIWDQWAASCPEKFRDRDQDKTWRSFRRNGIGIGTLFHHAQQHGWSPPRRDRVETETKGDANLPEQHSNPLANFVFVGDATSSSVSTENVDRGCHAARGIAVHRAAKAAQGKTFIAILIAVCAASGKPMFGHEVRERVGSVIVAAEGRGMSGARIAAAMNELGIEGDIPIAWVKTGCRIQPP